MFSTTNFYQVKDNAKILIKNRPSFEVLLRIFDFLELNEIEKCELVSKQWYRTILPRKFSTLKRRRRIYRLKIDYFPVSQWSKSFFEIDSHILAHIPNFYSRYERTINFETLGKHEGSPQIFTQYHSLFALAHATMVLRRDCNRSLGIQTSVSDDEKHSER